MRLLLALILLTSNCFASNLSLYDEPLTAFSSWVSGQTGKTIIVSSGLDSILVNVDGRYETPEDLLDLYKSVLKANALELIKDSDYYRVSKPIQRNVDEDRNIIKVYRLQNVRPETVYPSLLDFGVDGVKISSIPSSSSVSFYGKSDGVGKLMEFVQLLDVRPRQVLIEAVLLETTVGDAESIGIFLKSKLSDSGFSASVDTGFADFNFDSKGGILSYLTGGDVRLFVNAIRNNDDVSILSEPRLVALDREQAFMTVGQNVPFITGTQSTDGGGVVQSIERKDVGLSVRVTPELVGNDVRLTIYQEISNVTNSTQASDIITNQRAVETVARVKSGDSLVIGGLVSEEIQNLENSIPVLGAMPVVGRAFRSNSDSVVTRELQLLIKATII